jgi:hypothetical protein
VSITYTATSAITASITTTTDYPNPLKDDEVTVLAFGWVDAQPETSTGVWVLGAKTAGVTFIPTKAIKSLAPSVPKVETDLARTHEVAVTALDLASELRVKLARAMGEVHVAEDVAAGAMGVALATAEEVKERDGAKAAQPRPKATRSTAASKTANRTTARPGARGRSQRNAG